MSPNQRRPAKWAATSKWCWLLSLTPAIWYTTNTHHRVKKSPKSTTEMSSVAYVICAVQETRVVVNRQLAPPSQQCSSAFHPFDSNFFGKKTRLLWFSRLLTLLIWLWQLLVVPQTQEAIERKAISDKGGHYDCNNNQAKHHSERCFLRMFPIMVALLGEVCGVSSTPGMPAFFFFLPKGRILF